MPKYSNRDEYLYPDSDVLQNKLDIRDKALLDAAEADFAAARSYELAQHPLNGQFDLAHLQAMHNHLFQDLYDWAGRIRTIDISLPGAYFAHFQNIEASALELFEKLHCENHLANLAMDSFGSRAAWYLAEINAIHPFREGNGRTQREFISHLSYRNNYAINWDGMSRQQMTEASIQSFRHQNYAPMEMLIRNNLQSLPSV